MSDDLTPDVLDALPGWTGVEVRQIAHLWRIAGRDPGGVSRSGAGEDPIALAARLKEQADASTEPLQAPEKIDSEEVRLALLASWKTRMQARVTERADALLDAQMSRAEAVEMERQHRDLVQRLFAYREGAAPPLSRDDEAKLDQIGRAFAYQEAVASRASFKRSEIEALADLDAVRAYDVQGGWPAP